MPIRARTGADDTCTAWQGLRTRAAAGSTSSTPEDERRRNGEVLGHDRRYASRRVGPVAPDAGDCRGLAAAGGGDDHAGGDVSSRRLLGAHLPAASPQRRETVSGECLGCLTRFAINVRLPRPARCPDCGADVLALADIEAPGTQRRLPSGAPRIRGVKR